MSGVIAGFFVTPVTPSESVANVSTVTASGTSSTATVNSNSVTASWNGAGSGSYTYLWAVTTSDGITAVSPTSATTVFRKTSAVVGALYSGLATCTITDTVSSATQTTPTVGISLERTS